MPDSITGPFFKTIYYGGRWSQAPKHFDKQGLRLQN